MRQRKLYDQLSCFVCPDALTNAECVALECCLRDGGATIVTDLDASSNTTHIICHPTQYERFLPQRNERFIAIVRPEWVFKTFLLQTLVSVDRFSANPALIFSSLVIAAGPIDKDPRKVIDGLISHFGGQIVENESDSIGATHILSLDEPSQCDEPAHHQWFHLSYTQNDVLRNVQTWKKWLLDRPISLEFALPSCVVAYLGKVTGLSEQHHVNYSWIEDCVRRKTRVPEGAFSVKSTDVTAKKAPNWKTRPETQIEDIGLAQCARVYQSLKADAGGVELTLARRSSAERTSALQAALGGAIVLLAQHIPPVLKERISDVLKTAKAKVANVPLGDSYQDIVKKVVANTSFVVCRYQAGFEYEEAVRQNKRVVSIYWVLAGHSAYDGTEFDKQTAFQEAISRPVKSFGGIAGMQGFVITLSGYSSRTTPTREDIQIAIHATGACMLPVLSRTHSTHLLCFEAKGEKFKKAQSWRFENIVGHQWLFQCLSKWEHVPEDEFRFKLPKLADTTGNPSEQAAAVDETKSLEQATGRKAAAPLPSATPNSKLGGGRFDVDDILTELNETTPVTKEGESAAGEKVQEPKDVACKLFDTPSAEAKAQGKTGADDSEGVEKEKATATTKKSAKRDSVDLPENFELRIGKKRGAVTAATGAATTLDVPMEPDNEDDVDDQMDVDATVVSAKKPKANSKAAKSASANKKETTKAAGKKASASLMQASSDALEALNGGAKRATSTATSAKRKRGQSPHESADGSADNSVSESDKTADETPDISIATVTAASTKSKKAKASATTPAPAASSSKAKKEESAAAKRASVSKAAIAPPTAAAAATAKKESKKKATGSSSNASDFVFLLTGSREESAINESIIAALGGKASQTGRKFDHSSTHIICSELKRTEKFVAGCAGGKWILKPSYLEASSAAGRFVDEAPHEWGAIEGDSEFMDPRIWPQAPAFWRKARAEGKPGAFAGWRFLVHPKCVPPPDMCERIIEASDGLVMALTKTLNLAETVKSAASDKKPLLALVPSDLPARDAWLKKFNAQKIDAINASFLIDYVTKDQSKRPTPEDYRVTYDGEVLVPAREHAHLGLLLFVREHDRHAREEALGAGRPAHLTEHAVEHNQLFVLVLLHKRVHVVVVDEVVLRQVHGRADVAAGKVRVAHVDDKRTRRGRRAQRLGQLRRANALKEAHEGHDRRRMQQTRAASALHAAVQRHCSAALGLHLHRPTCSFGSGTVSTVSAVAVAEDLVRAPPGALRCQKDSSLRSLATRVLACELVTVKATKKTPEERFYEVELYDTVLFPEGGGQPWDTGKINDALVDKVYVKDGRCIHRVSLVDGVAVAFEKGQEAVATVDWDRRFDHMQQHSAQHLLSAIAEKYGYDTASWWLGEERCNVDLVHSSDSETARSGRKLISKEILLKIQEEANAAILDALPMIPIFVTPGSSEWNQIAAKFGAGEMPEAMRIMNIQGVENNPCCGVHVQNLAQLQSVRILNIESAGAGATRVWFVAGNCVNREFSRMFQREQALTKLLACAPEQHADRIEKLLQTYKSELKEIKPLQSKLASLIAIDLIAQSEQQQQQYQEEGAIVPVVCYHSPDGDLVFLQAIVKQLGDAKEQTVFVLVASDSDTSDGAFVLAGPEMFIMQHSRDAVQAIEGKGGGGKNGVFQGKATRLRELQSLIAKLQDLLLSEARA